jgi:hypothetical protein
MAPHLFSRLYPLLDLPCFPPAANTAPPPRPNSVASSFCAPAYPQSVLPSASMMPDSALRLLDQRGAQGLFTPFRSAIFPSSAYQSADSPSAPSPTPAPIQQFPQRARYDSEVVKSSESRPSREGQWAREAAAMICVDPGSPTSGQTTRRARVHEAASHQTRHETPRTYRLSQRGRGREVESLSTEMRLDVPIEGERGCASDRRRE